MICATQDSVEFSDGGFEVFLLGQTDELLRDFAVLKDDHGRDGADAVLDRDFLVVVDVELAVNAPAVGESFTSVDVTVVVEKEHCTVVLKAAEQVIRFYHSTNRTSSL